MCLLTKSKAERAGIQSLAKSYVWNFVDYITNTYIAFTMIYHVPGTMKAFNSFNHHNNSMT